MRGSLCLAQFGLSIQFPSLFVEGPRYSVACASHADTETQRKMLWLWTYNKKTPPFRLVETVSYPLPLQEH